MSTSKDRLFWKITDDTDWDSFQNYLESSFIADWVNKNNDINTLWSYKPQSNRKSFKIK
jgi:hypothetical protein